MVNPIADMLTRIRNAIKAGHEAVDVPLSNLKLEIVKILKQQGYVEDFSKVGRGNKKMIEIKLYKPSTISSIKMISRPGQRIYMKSSQMPGVKNNYGISIVSTSKGLMTNKDARKNKLGGEVLLEIY